MTICESGDRQFRRHPGRSPDCACGLYLAVPEIRPDFTHNQLMPDAELAGQPAAYWTGVAHKALIAYTRAQQAAKGYTQPQFWLLRNLSANDISPDGAGMTLPSCGRPWPPTSGPRTIWRRRPRYSWNAAG